MPLVSFANVSKVYHRTDGTPVTALRHVSFDVQTGEFVTVRGPSGCGKSSLLNILGCLDQATEGTYRLDGEDVSGYSDLQRSRLRCQRIGFVFQSFNLLPRTTAVENIELPMVYAGGKVDRRKAVAALDRVGLSARARHCGTELSGGEQQRVAIARALINDPALILADEPTGNLDSTAGADVLRLLQDLSAEGRTIVLVTPDDTVAAYAARELMLKDGAMVSDRAVVSTR
jgi:putative ABC transport system ATP-binding protein